MTNTTINTQVPNPKAQPSTKSEIPRGRIYDLLERTSNFGGDIIDFAEHFRRIMSRTH